MSGATDAVEELREQQGSVALVVLVEVVALRVDGTELATPTCASGPENKSGRVSGSASEIGFGEVTALRS